MAMDAEAKQKIQIALGLAIAIAALRTGYVMYERHEEAKEPATKVERGLNPDYYVTPKKLYPYDLKSARQLTEQPAWVKEGYGFPYFPWNAGTHHADFEHEAGKLLPLQKIEIKDVAVDKASGDSKLLVAVFEQEGKPYAFQIGTVEGPDYKFYADNILFYEDPRELYKHWPAEVWDAVSKHEVRPGMNELQADFAIGFGTLGVGSTETERTIHYPNGGKPMTVRYENGKAVEVKAGE